MRLYYIDESEGPRYYVRTALGVDAERWNALHQRVLDWRLELRDRYAVPVRPRATRLRPAGRTGQAGPQTANTDRRLAPEQGVEIFTGGLRVIEDAAPDHRRRRGRQRLPAQARRQRLRAGQPR